MHSTPFIWLVMPVQIGLDRFGMPPDLPNRPLALCASMHPKDHPLVRLHTPATLLEGHNATAIPGNLTKETVHGLFGPRGLHYTYHAPHTLALDFALSEWGESMGLMDDLAWTAEANHTTCHWLRHGLGWSAITPGSMSLGDLLNGTPPQASLITLVEKLGLPAVLGAAVGVVAMDVPVDPSTHHILNAYTETRQDLDLIRAWWARTTPHTPEVHTVLI